MLLNQKTESSKIATKRSILNKDVTLTWINTLKLTALEVELFERT